MVSLFCSGFVQLFHCTDLRLRFLWLKTKGNLPMNARHVELSDCWSSEQQPAPYYRLAAARARILQADATTPKVKQYLNKMIAHCDGLAGNVEPGVSRGSDRQAGRTTMARDHDRLQPGSRSASRREEGAVSVTGRGWMTWAESSV